jgi:hypothetical protein
MFIGELDDGHCDALLPVEEKDRYFDEVCL